MPISDKTIKTLWGLSGNKCAICRTKLIIPNDISDAKHLIIGEQCHIISKKKNGPRHQKLVNFNYDGYENLILLCSPHHKEVDETFQRYTIDVLKKIKSDHENFVKNFKKRPTIEEKMFTASKNAIIILEIDKIKERCLSVNWDKRSEILNELYRYSEHSNYKIADAVFSLLDYVAELTRGGMTDEVAISIFSLSLDFFPYLEDRKQKKTLIELGERCADMAFSHNIRFDNLFKELPHYNVWTNNS